ncbi:hypothetical protein AB0F25_30585 [Streptomyces wedmorensis]|uniref:hypothetical protein n=1 Tax=Streptomyces wedmorensis TaxID=43759 RepID=UPI00343792C9
MPEEQFNELMERLWGPYDGEIVAIEERAKRQAARARWSLRRIKLRAIWGRRPGE